MRAESARVGRRRWRWACAIRRPPDAQLVRQQVPVDEVPRVRHKHRKVVPHVEAYIYSQTLRCPKPEWQDAPSCTAVMICAGVATPSRGSHCTKHNAHSIVSYISSQRNTVECVRTPCDASVLSPGHGPRMSPSSGARHGCAASCTSRADVSAIGGGGGGGREVIGNCCARASRSNWSARTLAVMAKATTIE